MRSRSGEPSFGLPNDRTSKRVVGERGKLEGMQHLRCRVHLGSEGSRAPEEANSNSSWNPVRRVIVKDSTSVLAQIPKSSAT